MLDSVQEQIRETHGLHGAPPGTGWGNAEDAGDLPPALCKAAIAKRDDEIAEMARKFEEISAELAPARDERPRESSFDEEFRFEPCDDEVEAARLARFAPPRVAAGESGEPERAQRPVALQPHAPPSSPARWVSAAGQPAHFTSKRAPMILAIVVALAVGAGAGILATKGMRSSDTPMRTAMPGGFSASLRLDYELKLPSAVVAAHKP